MKASVEPLKSSVNDAMILKLTTDKISQTKGRFFSINEVCASTFVKRRSLYDFLSIASIFGICRKLSKDSFEWNGLQHVQETIENLRQNLEVEARISNLNQIFDCTLNSSIQSIAMSVIKLFLYLDTRFLDLRQVGKLFSQGRAKYKTMLRKLYTVASSLEIAGIVSRTNSVAEIRLNYSAREPPQQSPMNVRSLLNTESELIDTQLYEARRKMFMAEILPAPTKRIEPPAIIPIIPVLSSIDWRA
jgi:hypothetical protein